MFCWNRWLFHVIQIWTRNTWTWDSAGQDPVWVDLRGRKGWGRASNTTNWGPWSHTSPWTTIRTPKISNNYHRRLDCRSGCCRWIDTHFFNTKFSCDWTAINITNTAIYLICARFFPSKAIQSKHFPMTKIDHKPEAPEFKFVLYQSTNHCDDDKWRACAPVSSGG